MKRVFFLWLLILGCVAGRLMADATNQTLAGFNIKGLRLGMTLEGGEVDHLYEEVYHDRLADSVLYETPYYHIQSRFKDSTAIDLLFSSEKDHRAIFGIIQHQPYAARPKEAPSLEKLDEDLKVQWGEPGQLVTNQQGSLCLYIFPSEKTKARLTEPFSIEEEDLHRFSDMDFQQRVRLLGPQFEGLIVMVALHKGQIMQIVHELWDHPRAATVFNPGMP